MELEEINIEEIHNSEYNPRKIGGDEYIKLYNALTEFGLVLPLILNLKNNTLIGGHQRLKVLKDMGVKKLYLLRLNQIGWVFQSKDIKINSELQEKALNLSLNNIKGEFDREKLTEVLESLSECELDIELSGFEKIELENLNEEVKKKDITNYFDNEEIIEVMYENFEPFKDNDEIVNYLIDLPSAKFQFNKLCEGSSKIGMNISLLFNPQRFETLTLNSKYTMKELFNNEPYLVCKKIVEVYGDIGTKKRYPKQVGLNYGGFQLVNEFPPYTARDIYLNYCKDGDKILNPCAGWGGRLIGLASCRFENIEYWETDPATKTYNGLINIKKFLKLGSNIKQFNKPFEELDLPKNYFDFTFTSPPYFNTEIYSDDEGQSFKNKSNYEDWRDNFLKVMLDKIIYSLKSEGICLLNVGNNKYPIDSDLINYVNKEYNLRTKRISLFKIGGSGFGKRSGESGEPFIEFKKNDYLD